MAQKIQDKFTNIKVRSCPDQPKTVITNVNFAPVAGLIKRDARLTSISIAHSVSISSGSVIKILTLKRLISMLRIAN